MSAPKTWLDSEIITLMDNEAWAYRHQQDLMRQPICYRDMMECVLEIMKANGLIEDTP